MRPPILSNNENLVYGLAVSNPHSLPDEATIRMRHSLFGRLPEAIGNAGVASDYQHLWLGRCVTLAVAQEERVLANSGEMDLLNSHLAELRGLLTPYIGSVVVGKIASGQGTIAELSCLLNETGGFFNTPHTRGESLIDWKGLGRNESRELKRDIEGAITGFVRAKWGKEQVDSSAASAMVEVAIWGMYNEQTPADIRLRQAARLTRVLVRNWRGEKMPKDVSNALRDARTLLLQRSR